MATAYLLILAGYETTVNLIGNGILALLQNPTQLELLRANPSRLPDAVEEFLRFESPLNIATTAIHHRWRYESAAWKYPPTNWS